MATEDYLRYGVSIAFSAGVAYGMVQVMLGNLKERLTKVEDGDCEDIVRKLLFDESSMPRYMPASQCQKQHLDFARQIEKLENKIDNRDHIILDALERIHDKLRP